MSDRIAWYEAQGRDDDDGDEDLVDEAPALRRRVEPLEILSETSRFVAVAKPAGLPSVPTRQDPEGPTVLSELARLLVARDPQAAEPVLCHRLDRDTSGVMVLARDREAARGLMAHFRHGLVEKSYLALVIGAPQPPAGEVECRITVDRRRPGAMMVVGRGGKPAHSTYETLEVFRGLSWVRVRNLTGRTHQARLVLTTLGTPCAVDPLYGSAEGVLLSRWKRGYRTGRGRPERPLVDRLTLHAERIAFDDPTDPGRLFECVAPLPRDLEATLRQLRRHAAPGSL